jgi:Leucine-rich repeat (LRR) protein
MSASSPGENLPSQTIESAPSSGLGRVIDLTARAATSWIGLATAYLGAVTAAVIAFQKLPEPLNKAPLWLRIAALSAVPVLALIFHAIPALVEKRRKKRLTEISGSLQSGYFRLAPRDEEASFTRPDGKHEEILRWLDRRTRSLLYLTGLSGSGKSSLLAAWVLPKLAQQNTVVIRLRGYQDPIAALEQELQRPGVIWQRSSSGPAELVSLLERACKYIKLKRLLIVLDQFEEFVILQDADKQKRLGDLLTSLRENPVGDVTFLLVFRSDYIGLIEKLGLPPLDQNTNWNEIPPFTESAARDFIRGSGLQVSDELLRDVLREATEIEQARGLIRPVTINLCGLVLGRFATGLPHGFRPGGLIRGFLREAVLLPSVREVAPLLIPHLITNYVTKRPRTVTELAQETAIEPAAVRGCLRVLGQSDRAIVRPLDADQQTWEISHDFLVPLLDSIVSRWTISLWKRVRPWLPWAAAATLAVVLIGASSWQRDPLADLADLGWQVRRTDDGGVELSSGTPPEGSAGALAKIKGPIRMRIGEIGRVSEWGAAKNLIGLDLHGGKVSDVSPLKALENLTELYLSDTDVSDVSPLKNLKNLSLLELLDTDVSDVSSLKDLKNLTSLRLGGPNVSDVSPLKEFKNLTSLELSGPKVSDVSPLKELKNLTKLRLSSPKVSDVSPLKDLKNLTMLRLTGPKVSDVSPLKDLENLTLLELGDTNVSDVSPLKDLKNLTFLDLLGTKVSDVSPLKNLKHLTQLDLGETNVSDVSPLKNLKNLTLLGLGRTKISDVSPLKDLENLTKLNLSETNVSDVSPLKDLKNLTLLELHGTKVSDVSPLKNLKNLTKLNLSETNVSDVSPLKDLKNLALLELHGAKVSDVSPLKDLKNLQIVR